MLDVSIIIINYNSAQYTVNCVKSILQFTQNNLNYEIIIVDNASTNEDFTFLENELKKISSPKIRLISSPINTGFGEGNNIGLENSQPSEYLAFINNDVLFVEDNLTEMRKFMQTTPDCGTCSPQSYDGQGKFIRTFDYWASPEREILGRKILHLTQPKKYIKRNKKYNAPLKVPFISGSFMFFRRKEFEQIGGFDNSIFLYYEETDICIRLYKILHKFAYLLPQYRYIHFVSKSTQKNLDIKIEQKLSLLYILEKHYGTQARQKVENYLRREYGVKKFIKPKYKRLYEVLKNGADLKTYSLKQQQKPISR